MVKGRRVRSASDCVTAGVVLVEGEEDPPDGHRREQPEHQQDQGREDETDEKASSASEKLSRPQNRDRETNKGQKHLSSKP